MLMDVTEYEQIRDYLSRKLIPSEMKSDRYQRKNFVRKCKGVSLQNNKLMKVISLIIYSAGKLSTYAIWNIRLSRRRME